MVSENLTRRGYFKKSDCVAMFVSCVYSYSGDLCQTSLRINEVYRSLMYGAHNWEVVIQFHLGYW